MSRGGRQTHALSDGSGLQKVDPAQAPISTALGVLGMPGMTAYMGLLEIGRPAVGETVVVAAASGAVGSVVGQIARIKGSRAVCRSLGGLGLLGWRRSDAAKRSPYERANRQMDLKGPP